MATQPVTLLTEIECLRIERAAVFKSEFVDGQMYTMAGGTGSANFSSPNFKV